MHAVSPFAPTNVSELPFGGLYRLVEATAGKPVASSRRRIDVFTLRVIWQELPGMNNLDKTQRYFVVEVKASAPHTARNVALHENFPFLSLPDVLRTGASWCGKKRALAS